MKRWPIQPLGDFIAKKSGSVDPSKFPDEVFDLYSIPAFDSGEPEIRAGKGIGSAKQIVEPGDVLLSRIVPHIRRSWVVGAERGARLIASGEWIVFRSPQLHPDFLRHFLASDPFHAQFMQTVSGVGGSLLRAKVSEVAKIEIAVPPMAVQARIVKLLGEADNLRKLRGRADRRTATLLPALFNEMFGDVGVASIGSRMVKLEEVADKITDGEHLTPKRTNSGIKLLSARNVRDGFLDLVDVDYIGLEEYQRINKRCNPEYGDVLISCSGTIGRVAVVQTHEPFSLVRSVALVKPKRHILRPVYLEHYLRTPFMAARMSATANASSQANLFQNQIRTLPVFIPEIAHQDRFVERVTEIRELEASQAASRQRLENLFQSLLHGAFAGEL
jgi:type I restriction enzyme S subunit